MQSPTGTDCMGGHTPQALVPKGNASDAAMEWFCP